MEMVLRPVFGLLAAWLCSATDAAWAVPPRTPTPEPFVSKYKPGTIVVRIRERRLYHLIGPGQAVSYSIGAARPNIQFYGRTVVTHKRERPIWIPTPNQRRLYRGLPGRVDPGPNNPLGSRAINLATGNLRIHGTNEPTTIGSALSDGCIRMRDVDIENLFQRVKVGALVIIEH
jgi:lipoprotein-anchoring transpeptidase ErfK/SrfK